MQKSTDYCENELAMHFNRHLTFIQILLFTRICLSVCIVLYAEIKINNEFHEKYRLIGRCEQKLVHRVPFIKHCYSFYDVFCFPLFVFHNLHVHLHIFRTVILHLIFTIMPKQHDH